MTDDSEGKISRRKFVKGTIAGVAAGAVVGAASGLLSAPVKAQTVSSPQATTTGSTDIPLDQQVWSFEVPPAPIPSSQITQTLTADVVVLGAGNSGVPAALKATQMGAKVVVLEKLPAINVQGFNYGVLNSKIHEQQGVVVNRDQVISDIMKYSRGRDDQRLISLWADNSEEAVNWMLGIFDQMNVPVVNMQGTPVGVYIETHPEKQENATAGSPGMSRYGMNFYYQPTTLFILAAQATGTMAAALAKLGVSIMYSTPAVQLLSSNNTVTGVIAKGPKGYIQVNSKAVVVSSGGYEGNTLMKLKYIPDAQAVAELVGKPTNTGDGILMGQWAGAAIDQWPHCPMFFDGYGLGFTTTNQMDMPAWPLVRQPWLYVNMNGERYMNEDQPYGDVCLGDVYQPTHRKWVIFDDKYHYASTLLALGSTVCKRMTNIYLPWAIYDGGITTPDTARHESTAATDLMKKGLILQANTFSDLAKAMGVPVTTFTNTVARYNYLCSPRSQTRQPHDDDFGKDAMKMVPLDTPPYYAAKTGPGLLVTFGGLRVNTQLQVLAKDYQTVINGLYATGNSAGGFESYQYAVSVTGFSLGRALTTGYVAGKNAAAYAASTKS